MRILRSRALNVTCRGVAILILGCAFGQPTFGQSPIQEREQRALAEPYKGVTMDGTPAMGLFSIRSTGVSTEPVREAAERFTATLSETQRNAALYSIDDREWRRWSNTHSYRREGVSFGEMDDQQRRAAFGLLEASLSAKGFQTSRDIMRLNEHIAELLNNFQGYGEGLYWLTIMGEPSATEPWGWQIDGHHLVINYFVLGDQVVMTPTFMGSEPVVATSGKYAGTRILDAEQDTGLALVNALTSDQRRQAILEAGKPGDNAVAEHFSDNLVLAYAGIRADVLSAGQRAMLMQLIELYVGNMDDGHAAEKMNEVSEHLDETYFGWIGGTGPGDVFYYRIHSPVILIEFDHRTPIAFKGPKVPSRRHIHTVVRTPNGNDYGKDLLRQHYQDHDHGPSGDHVHK
jgi:Protein of unknown function (DUF3500)